MTNSPMDPNVIEEAEHEALKKFKERIRDVLPTLREYYSHDISLLRWLRARELNISQSEDMLRKSIDWRAKNDVDNIRDWKVPDFINNNYPFQISGFSKNGSIIISANFGRWDIRKAVSNGFKSEMVCYVDQILETVMNFMETRSTKDSMMSQFVVVADYEGFSLRQLTSKETIECILEIVRRFEGNYPETLCTAWVINAPKIFEILFALVKPLLTPRTVSKIKVFGSNVDQWRSAVLECAEPDQLTSHYGGSNTSCKDYKIADGLNIFPVHEIFPENEFTPVIVDAGMKHVVKYSLFKNNKICWNFRTMDYDIGFSFIYSETDSTGAKESQTVSTEEDEVLFECIRADSHRHLQTGLFIAQKAGTYSLVFDNSFSRFRKKSLSFCVRTSTVSVGSPIKS